VQRALARARSALGAGADSAHDRLAQLLERHAELQSTASDPVAASARRRLVVRTGERYRLVPLDEVAWLESAGNYVRVHSRGRSHLLRTPLRELEKTLDPHQFVRIHRGIIVNLDVIAEVVPASHGDCDVVLSDGRRLRMSRSYRHNLLVG
jgi:two-component system LytT family response regulator